MCNLFSFVHDGKNIYYFNADQRKNGVRMPDGNPIGGYDSHSSITCFYKLDDDAVNKFEYNPFTDKLVLDGNTICEWDEKTIREQLAGIDWQPMAGDVEGAREFLRSLNTVPRFKPDGTVEGCEGIKVYETWAAARDAAWAAAGAAATTAARDAARDAAWAAAWAAARAAAGAAARDATWAAAGAAATIAARDATRDAVNYCVMFYVCGDLQIDEKHRDYIRKCFEIWKHGYGVIGDVHGVLYVYKRVM